MRPDRNATSSNDRSPAVNRAHHLADHTAPCEHAQAVGLEHESDAFRSERRPALEYHDVETGVGAQHREREPREAGAGDDDVDPLAAGHARRRAQRRRARLTGISPPTSVSAVFSATGS